MGHDIYGFHGKDKKLQIAYLRRGAFNGQARSIYVALGAEKHDCGCSGCGTEQFFTREQLRLALAKLPRDDDHEEEREFIANCIGAGEVGAMIDFC